MEPQLIVAGIAGFFIYLYWLGRTVFDTSIAVKGLLGSIESNGKETADNGEEITKLRTWRHEVSNLVQQHEFRLDQLDNKVERLEDAT